MEKVISIDFNREKGVVVDFNNEPENMCYWGGAEIDGLIGFTEEQNKEIVDFVNKLESWMNV